MVVPLLAGNDLGSIVGSDLLPHLYLCNGSMYSLAILPVNGKYSAGPGQGIFVVGVSVQWGSFY